MHELTNNIPRITSIRIFPEPVSLVLKPNLADGGNMKKGEKECRKYSAGQIICVERVIELIYQTNVL